MRRLAEAGELWINPEGRYCPPCCKPKHEAITHYPPPDHSDKE